MVSTGWNLRGGGGGGGPTCKFNICGRGGCPDMEEQGASTGGLGVVSTCGSVPCGGGSGPLQILNAGMRR